MSTSVAQILPRAASLLSKRYCSSYNRYGNGYSYNNCNSAWYRFGRWILAGILLLIGIVFFLGVLFCMRRRRRRAMRYQANNQPMAYQPQGGAYNQGYAPPQQQQYGAAQGYYGQTGGVTQPQGAYVK